MTGNAFFIAIRKEDDVMFWKKDKNALPGPKGLPNPVGRDIVTKLGGEPNRTWNLKAVIRPKGEEKDTFEVRVFDDTQAASRKIAVKDYNSLSEYPELILYEGWYNKTGQAEVRKRS
jgi:hypothetical protein